MNFEDTAVPSSDSGEELPVEDECVATDMGLDAEKRKRTDKTTARKARQFMVVPGPRLEEYVATLGCNRLFEDMLTGEPHAGNDRDDFWEVYSPYRVSAFLGGKTTKHFDLHSGWNLLDCDTVKRFWKW